MSIKGTFSSHNIAHEMNCTFCRWSVPLKLPCGMSYQSIWYSSSLCSFNNTVSNFRHSSGLSINSGSWAHSYLSEPCRLSVFCVQVRKHRHDSRDSGTPSFLYFTRRFWNQIFTCFSDKLRYVAISIRLRRDRYILAENSLSSSRSWVLVKAVRILLLLLLLRSSVELVTPGNI